MIGYVQQVAAVYVLKQDSFDSEGSKIADAINIYGGARLCKVQIDRRNKFRDERTLAIAQRVINGNLGIIQTEKLVGQKSFILRIIPVLLCVFLETVDVTEIVNKSEHCAALDRIDVRLFETLRPWLDSIIISELLGKTSVEKL